MEDNKSFWNRNAKRYDKMQRGSKKSQKFWEELEKKTTSYITGEMSVLELAMGPAMLTAAIAGVCKDLIATDYAEEMVEQAKKKDMPSNVTLETADATNLKYEENQFDVVVIANALHIMPDPVKALAEIRRVLKPDGILIAPTYTRGMSRTSLKAFIINLAGFKTYSKWDDVAYAAFLNSQGWSVIEREMILGNTYPECFAVCKAKQKRKDMFAKSEDSKVIEKVFLEATKHFDEVESFILFGASQSSPQQASCILTYASDERLESAKESGQTNTVREWCQEELTKLGYTSESFTVEKLGYTLDYYFLSQETLARDYDNNWLNYLEAVKYNEYNNQA